jgi:hypothetical protein
MARVGKAIESVGFDSMRFASVVVVPMGWIPLRFASIRLSSASRSWRRSMTALMLPHSALCETARLEVRKRFRRCERERP